MKVSMIAAVARNGVIGKDNALPWRLPEDLAFFKQTTLGCPVLMGRKTYESINRPLPGRLNVVLSTQSDWQPQPAKDGTPRAVIAYPDQLPQGDQTHIAKVTNLADAVKWLQGFEQVFLIGGSQLYQQALEQDLVDELLLTELAADFDGDAWLPNWDKNRFKEVQRTPNPATEDRDWSFDFVKYVRTTNQ